MKKLTATILVLIMLSLSIQAKPKKFVATVYCLKGKTRSGILVKKGVIAVDPRVIPLGSKVRLVGANGVSGVYIAADTGKKIKGKRVDIWHPSKKFAKLFGKRLVTVEVIS